MIDLGQHWSKSQKYTKIHIFFNKYALYFVGTLFLPKKKPPEGTAPASKVGWSYPITFRSLVVKHTARTQNFDQFFNIFLHFSNLFGIIRDASRGSLEVVRSNFRHFCFEIFVYPKSVGEGLEWSLEWS